LFGQATAFLDCEFENKCSSTGLVAGILGASCSSISNSPATTSAMPTSVLAQTSATPLLPTSSAVYMPSQTSAMPTATSCPAPTATPTIAANVAANCETYAELPADYCGITCEGICDYLNITFAEFYAWNPNGTFPVNSTPLSFPQGVEHIFWLAASQVIKLCSTSQLTIA